MDGRTAETPAGSEIGASGPADPHAGLTPLMAAARLTRARVAVIRCEMHWERPWRIRAAELAAKVVVFLGAHLRLARDLWRHRDRDLILVREFLTPILLLVWPLIWPLRRRVWFLVNHNLQEAHQKPIARAILRLLWRSGLNLACLETPDGFAEVGITPGPRLLVLPHPIGPLAPPRAPGSGPPVVGVVGEIRAEKDTARILERLADLRDRGTIEARLLLGCPEAEARAYWAGRGFETLDTTTPEAYGEALARADFVVLNYLRERYWYRASGVAADAIARRTAVVCPDFPVMRHQVGEPAAVGATFADIDRLGVAINRALALRPGLDAAFVRQAEARGPEAIAARLDAFIESMTTGS